MGLLDDAIREHLDLKRRRGADPSEIAREEADALGPVRRDAGAEDEELLGAEDAGTYADHEPAPVAYDDELVGVEDRLVPSEPPHTHDDVYPEPEEESATPPHGDPLAHQQTREFSATELDDALRQEEDAPAPAPAPAPAADDEDTDDEDVLEETPDFLQETPEHDRLWFEQKPPKDFDF